MLSILILGKKRLRIAPLGGKKGDFYFFSVLFLQSQNTYTGSFCDEMMLCLFHKDRLFGSLAFPSLNLALLAVTSPQQCLPNSTQTAKWNCKCEDALGYQTYTYQDTHIDLSNKNNPDDSALTQRESSFLLLSSLGKVSTLSITPSSTICRSQVTLLTKPLRSWLFLPIHPISILLTHSGN